MQNFTILNWITVLLIALQLTGLISISWWLVLLPTYIFFGILFVLMLVFCVANVLVVIMAMKKRDLDKINNRFGTSGYVYKYKREDKNNDSKLQ